MVEPTDQSGSLRAIRAQREAAAIAILRQLGENAAVDLAKTFERDLCVSRATAYRMIKRFHACGVLVARRLRAVGRPRGARSLGAQREAIIRESGLRYVAAERLADPPKFSALVAEIAEKCRAQNLSPPNWRTIRQRLTDIDGARESR